MSGKLDKTSNLFVHLEGSDAFESCGHDYLYDLHFHVNYFCPTIIVFHGVVLDRQIHQEDYHHQYFQ